MSGLNGISAFQSLYDNQKGGVSIPLYADMTAEQLAIRLPISVGIARQIIDNSVDALFGENKLLGITMVGDDESPLQAAWDKFFVKNNMRARLLKDAVTLFVEGGIFYFIGYKPGGSNVFPLITIPYSHLWDVLLDDDLEQLPIQFIFQWEDIWFERSQELRRWRRVTFDSFSIRYYRAEGTHTSGDDGVDKELLLTKEQEHDIGVIPLVHIAHAAQTGVVLGTSMLSPIEPMLDAINQMMSDAYWQAYNDQAMLKAINIQPPADDDDPENDANVRLGGDQIHYLTQSEDSLKQDIDRVPAVGTPDSFFKTLELLVAHAYRSANEISIDATKWASTNISGQALRILNQPQARKTHRNRVTWENAFIQLARLLFKLMQTKSVSLSPAGDYIVGNLSGEYETAVTAWGELIVGDEVESQQVILEDLKAGLITIDQAKKLRGLDYAVEKTSDKPV